jgi:hypothetical protein
LILAVSVSVHRLVVVPPLVEVAALHPLAVAAVITLPARTVAETVTATMTDVTGVIVLALQRTGKQDEGYWLCVYTNSSNIVTVIPKRSVSVIVMNLVKTAPTAMTGKVG